MCCRDRAAPGKEVPGKEVPDKEAMDRPWPPTARFFIGTSTAIRRALLWLVRRTGSRFEKQAKLVVPVGPRGSFDERGAADPYVIRRGEYFYLFYLGQDRARRQTLGVARSPDGIEWEKLRANPVLELGGRDAFDENGLGEPAVWTSGGSYWMLYTGRDRGEHRRLGLARSTDGVHWEREPSFTPVGGEQAWDSMVVCDPTVLVEGSAIRVWFGGGDVPHPVANIHGQIGVAELRGQQVP